MLLDALVRGSEPALCQALLVRMGERALAALLDLAGQSDPGARRVAIYPLAAVGGEQALTAIRGLLYDPDEGVRDAALLALQSLWSAGGASVQPGAGAAAALPPAEPAPPGAAADAQPGPPGAAADTQPGPTGSRLIEVAVLGPMVVRAGGVESRAGGRPSPGTCWRT